MPQIEILIYRADDGGPLFVHWLNSLQTTPVIAALPVWPSWKNMDTSCDGPMPRIPGRASTSLRVKYGRVNYRMLDFFHGRDAAVVSHGFAKERLIPPGEIKLALERKQDFERDSERHTFNTEE